MPVIQSTVLRRQAPLRHTYQRQPEQAQIIKQVRTMSVAGPDPFHGVVVPGDSYKVAIPYGIDRAVGGFHDAPNPGELLCAALAACEDATIRMLADVLGVPIEELEVEVCGKVDVRASLGMQVATPVAFQAMACIVHLQVAPDTPPPLLQRLLTGAERSCINLATLKEGIPIELEFDIQADLHTSAGT